MILRLIKAETWVRRGITFCFLSINFCFVLTLYFWRSQGPRSMLIGLTIQNLCSGNIGIFADGSLNGCSLRLQISRCTSLISPTGRRLMESQLTLTRHQVIGVLESSTHSGGQRLVDAL